MVGVWRDAAPILATLEAVRRNLALVTLSAGLIAAVVLYLVFRSAQGADHAARPRPSSTRSTATR